MDTNICNMYCNYRPSKSSTNLYTPVCEIHYIFSIFACTALYRSNKRAPWCVASGYARVINVQESIHCFTQRLQYSSGRNKDLPQLHL